MNTDIQRNNLISEGDRESFYRVVFSRRDVRGQFLPDPVDVKVLARILQAAHHAPSVGFMQPWDFIIIESEKIRRQIHNVFNQAHNEAAEMFEEERKETYKSLKLEGIMDAPVNICITCDRRRTGPVVIGRTHIREMDIYSSVCAIQNFWLAARAEGLGVGWVSIFHEDALKNILDLPEHIVPVGYLCLGHVKYFYDRPELELVGWQKRMPLEQLVNFDKWGNQEEPEGSSLKKELKMQKNVLLKGNCQK
jgi:5,6-dimethylbenzimidazole synthase